MMPSNRRWPTRFAVSMAIGCLLWISGCSSDPEKTSLFDHSHETPDHWPRNLGDTSAMIRERLEKLDVNDSSAAAELVDLVSWTPEFAADTSMSEGQWDPIYEASESLRLRLEDSRGNWDNENRQQAQRLCVLIDAAWSQLPDEEKQTGRLQGHGHTHHHGEDHGHSHGHGHDHLDDHHGHDHGHGHAHHDHDQGHSHVHGHEHSHQDHDHEHEHKHGHDHGHPNDRGSERGAS